MTTRGLSREMGENLRDYQLWFFLRSGGRRHFRVLECATDSEAISVARTAARGQRAELWVGNRFVCEIEPTMGAAVNRRLTSSTNARSPLDAG